MYSRFAPLLKYSPKVTSLRYTSQYGPYKPIKFTTSSAYNKYNATESFYGGQGSGQDHLPDSHNYFLAGSLSVGVLYLIWFRDDGDNEGFKSWVVPLHEQLPEYAIPILESALIENRKAGRPTRDIEKKLADLKSKKEEKLTVNTGEKKDSTVRI